MFERLTRYADAEGMAGPAFIMLIATVVGGGCNFIYQLMMANLIPRDYAELLALLAILYIVTVPALAVSSVLIRYVSKYDALGRDSVISWLIKRILTLTVVAGLIIAVSLILILSVPEVQSTLGLTSTLPVLLLAVAVFLSLISPVGQGPLQGLQRFTSLGLISIVNYVLKLTIGVGMVILGYGVAGAVGGVLIGVAVGAALSLIMVRKYLLAPGQSVESKEIWWFTLPAMIGILCFTILTQVDAIFAQSLLPKPQAAYYAAASTLAKIILFLPGAVSTVMFPKISKAHTENGATNRILKAAFAMTLFLAGMVVAVYFLFPNFVLDILIPNNPDRALIAPILQWLGVAMLFLGLANLFMLYGLATDGHAYITIMGLSVLVLVGLVFGTIATGVVFTPILLVQIMILTGLFIVILSATYLIIIEKEWRPRYGGFN